MSTEKLSIRQVKAARELLGWTQRDLAARSGVSLPTIMRLEAQGGDLGGRATTVEAIRAALEGCGVLFLDGNGGGPGVRMAGMSERLKE